MLSALVMFQVITLITCLLQVIPESAKLNYVNDKYVENGTLTVRRYGRRSPYYINLWAITRVPLENNIMIHIILTQYLHNEYRRSFIEIHYKLCDFVNHEPYIGAIFKKRGLACPLPKGTYDFSNLTIMSDVFPNVFPFEKGGAEVELADQDSGETVARLELHLRFVQKKSG